MLSVVFKDKWFAHAVKERTLDSLITEILLWLLDQRVPRMHDGSLSSYLFLICFCNYSKQTYRVGARANDLHMLKTLLYELCKLRGTAIKGHLSMVPIDMEPQPIILAYIDLNLQTLAAARMLTPTRPTGLI
ncbi:hypothetical protein Tco_0860919 [Tanacetum coccineum]|uniref:Uncharacterized protein n=1 Tax=Tanacetum coccineum TaxID=301880 RepID=A0ABQ5BII6_9ASTR